MTAASVVAVLQNTPRVALALAALLVVIGVGSLVSTVVNVLIGREGR